MKPLAIALIAAGGLATGIGVLFAVLMIPEGQDLNWVALLVGMGVGSILEIAGIFLLISEQRNQSPGR